MTILAEYRLHDVAAGDDRAVMIVSRTRGYSVRCVNYCPPVSRPFPRTDYSRVTTTLVDGPLSVCWHDFYQQVNYLSRCYGGSPHEL